MRLAQSGAPGMRGEVAGRLSTVLLADAMSRVAGQGPSGAGRRRQMAWPPATRRPGRYLLENGMPCIWSTNHPVGQRVMGIFPKPLSRKATL